MLAPGQPAPWFHAQALGGNPRYAFDTVAGRWIVMLLMGSAAPEASQGALRLVEANRDLFDDERACFFGVTIDPVDGALQRVASQLPGIRWFEDYDRRVSILYGAARPDGDAGDYSPHWLLLDPMLRVKRRAAIGEGPALLAQLRTELDRPVELQTAPVLIVPDILEPDLCRELIAYYDRQGGADSGFMRDEDGVTVETIDHGRKRRADCPILDDRLRAMARARMTHRVRPMIQRAFQFDATRIERFIVACYDSKEGGRFRAHRDNTTAGTAHRKFACTINLNSEDFEGGDLSFPEFGARTYRAPTGGAVIFSCALLHEAQPVRAGRRLAFLPFFYDDEGARLRERNLASVSPRFGGYRSGLPA